MAKKKEGIKLSSSSKITKKYGSGKASDFALESDTILRIPTRVLTVNHQTNGGLPYGKILELFGPESVGKSLLATDYAYVTIAMGGEVIWADAENSWNNTWASENGLDLEKIWLLPNENCIETISDWALETMMEVRSRLLNNEPILFVIDSTAALDTVDNIGVSQTDKKAEMGNRAKKIYEFFRLRNKLFGKLGVSVILINQLRSKVGASKYEDPDTTPGGQAAKFYASQRIALVRGKAIKEVLKGKEVKVGQNVYIRTKKDKTGPPGETSAAKVYFRKTTKHTVGFDKYFGLPELLVDLGIVERKKGSSRYYYKEKMIANGEDAMNRVLTEDEELRRKLIKKSKILTISKAIERMENVKVNLFPIESKKKSSTDEQSIDGDE